MIIVIAKKCERQIKEGVWFFRWCDWSSSEIVLIRGGVFSSWYCKKKKKNELEEREKKN